MSSSDNFRQKKLFFLINIRILRVQLMMELKTLIKIGIFVLFWGFCCLFVCFLQLEFPLMFTITTQKCIITLILYIRVFFGS